jgi:predicted metal-dependent peptidase
MPWEKIVYSDCVPTAVTKEGALFINPEWWETLSEEEQELAIKHEYLHALAVLQRREASHLRGIEPGSDVPINPLFESEEVK